MNIYNYCSTDFLHDSPEEEMLLDEEFDEIELEDSLELDDAAELPSRPDSDENLWEEEVVKMLH